MVLCLCTLSSRAQFQHPINDILNFRLNLLEDINPMPPTRHGIKSITEIDPSKDNTTYGYSRKGKLEYYKKQIESGFIKNGKKINNTSNKRCAWIPK